MCGIFGQIGSSPADEKCGLELRHRGPDDGGLKYFALSDGSVWVSLQHRRLSIIDLSSAGHQRMLLATDHMGKKPLFYSHTEAGRKFVFASEIKAILKSGTPAEPDPVALHDYLTYLYFPYPSTAFKHVRKMAPGSAMEILVESDGNLRKREWKYWDAAETAGAPLQMSEAEMIDRARELMEESVKLRMISDVPLGLFLSGGLDSSAITAFASKNNAEQVKTFTIGFENSKFYDEQLVAKLVAEKFNTDHHILQADEACAAYMTKVVGHFDEPFGNPTAILEYIITKQMRKHVTVAISGDGGDELFGGYVRYAGAALARKYRQLPQFITKGLVSRLSGLMNDATDGRHGFRRAREFAQSAWQAEEDMYIDWVGYFSADEKQKLYAPGFAASVAGRNSGDFLRQFFRRGEKLDPLSRLGYVDAASFLCCNCLEYADRMSMANSLEVRAPFTDYRLFEFAMQVPQRMKVRNMTTKWITRQAMRDILPQEVLAKKKMGFNPPLPQWINGELRPVIQQFLSPAAIERRGIFRPDAVQKLLRDHEEDRRDNALKIWALLMIEVWQRMYFDKQPEELVLESVLGEARRKPVVQVGQVEKPKADVICIR